MSIEKIAARCKCGVYLTINAHRDVYDTARNRIEGNDPHSFMSEELADVSLEVREKMIATNTIVDLQFYPDSPIGFYRILHYDLKMALDEAVAILEGRA